MNFLHPGLAIAAVLAVSIPIIIHLLFRQRRKPIVWAAMRFLMEAYKKQRRRLQLEQLILLLLRCLVVLLLGLAIARPLLARAGLLGGLAGGRTVVLMIDNSLAATITDPETPGDGAALARHKSAANELLGTLGPADRVALITLARPAQAVVMPASSNLAAIARLIEDIPATDAPTDLPGAVGLIAAAREGDASGSAASQPIALALFSDFLRGSADLAASLPGVPGADESTTILATQPRRSPRANTQVLSITPLRAVSLNESRDGEQRRSIQGRIALRRTGDDLSAGQAVTVRVAAIRPDGQPAGPTVSAMARFDPGSGEASVALRVPIDGDEDATAARRIAAADILRVTIDDDPIVGDNTAWHLVPRRDALRIALIAQRRFGGLPTADQLGPADWLRLAARPARQAPVDVLDLEPAAVDRAALRGFDAAFIPRPDLLSEVAWLALREFADAGGLVLVTPPAEASVALWTDPMLAAFGLDWSIAREPIAYERARAMAVEQPRSALLSFIAAELDALAASVRVFRALPLEAMPEDATPLLSFETPAGASPLLLVTTPGAGVSSGPDHNDVNDVSRPSRGLFAFMVVAMDLGWTDLPAKPLMVPLIQELLRQGVGAAAGGGASLAGRLPELPPGAVGTNAAPPARVGEDRGGAIVRAGLYGAVDESGRIAGSVAVNADPAAGDVAGNPPDAVRQWLVGLLPAEGDAADRVVFFEPGNLAELAESETASSAGTLLLLIIALLAALAETVLARFFSHAKRDTIAARLSTPGAGEPAGRALSGKGAAA